MFDGDLFLGIKSLIFPVLPLFALLYFLLKLYWKHVEDEMYRKFNDAPKDTVIIHFFPAIAFPSKIPTCQPWVHKLQLFCKLTKIPYINDVEYPFGPNGKSPWISLNGHHKSDSQIVIQFLEKKFDISPEILSGGYSDEELAIARAVRVMLEERFYWALPLWRWVWEEGKALWYRDWSCLDLPIHKPLSLLRLKFNRLYITQTWEQGIGRLPKNEALQMLCGDLRTVSYILGSKKYILGERPCAEDCSIFGMLAQALYGMPESPYEKLIKEELPNLKLYVDRIKTEFFPDWK